MQPEMTIEINETLRYAAYYDTYPFDYLTEWDHDAWGLFSISVSRWTNALNLDTFGLNARLSEVMEWTEHSWNHKHAETELAKAISRAGYEYKFVQLNGGSQSTWNYVVVYWDPKQITSADGLTEELEAWYSGEVYSVALEQKVTYKELGGAREMHEWETVDTISCVLFTDSYKFTLETCHDMLGNPLSVAA